MVTERECRRRTDVTRYPYGRTMRSFLFLFHSFGSAGALHNARTELEVTHARQVQAAAIARRVGTIDAVAARSVSASPSRPVVAAAAA